MPKQVTYGGQAVIEGVMMRGVKSLAIAVRRPDGDIVLERRQIKTAQEKWPVLKSPILRGFVALLESLVIGMQALAFSANNSLAEDEEEITTKEMAVTMAVALVFGIILFVIIPTGAVHFIQQAIPSPFWQNVVEGVLRIAIFLGYVVLIARMKDIERVFQYHGAEHKVIHTYEAGEDLTVENARRHPTLHPRCGTSFLLLVMVISIFVFSLLGNGDLWWRISSRILLLPLVAGISYELLKFGGKYAAYRIVSLMNAPGLLLQQLTTREPDDQQLAVAISALEAVLQEDRQPCH